MSTLNTLTERLASISRQKKELVEELRLDFFPLVKHIFDKLPEEIESLGWTQYSPYFNDGDDCTFSVNLDLTYGIKVNKDYLEECKYFEDVDIYTLTKHIKNDGSYEKWISQYPEYTLGEVVTSDKINTINTLNEFIKIIDSVGEEMLEELFGNHVEVVILRDGRVYTNEYDHD